MGWDSNPRDSCPPTRFPSVRLRPLGHPSSAFAARQESWTQWSASRSDRAPFDRRTVIAAGAAEQVLDRRRVQGLADPRRGVQEQRRVKGMFVHGNVA